MPVIEYLNFVALVCVRGYTFVSDTHIIPILSDDVGPCMLRQSLPIILLTYNRMQAQNTTRAFVCVFMRNTHSWTWRDSVDTHRMHKNRHSQHSCRCRWCRTKHVGSTLPASAGAGWESGGNGWTPWLAASGCGSGPSPSTAAEWWLTRFQRCWRTSGLEVRGGDRVGHEGGFGSVRWIYLWRIILLCLSTFGESEK